MTTGNQRKYLERIEVEALSDIAWRQALEQLEAFSFFATPEWGHILADSQLGFQSQALLFKGPGTEILLPIATRPDRWGLNIYRSMPFGTYGGPLVVYGPRPVEHLPWARFISQYLKDRRRFGYLSASPGPYAHLPLRGICITHTTHILDLQGEGDILAKATRYQVRKAQRLGVTVSVDNSLESFREYYRMLEASAARWGLARPGQPWSLFESLARHADAESVRLWVASAEGVPAAGALCFYGRGEVFYWSGAMRQELAYSRPNNLLHWNIVEDAAARGYRFYNMGASGDLAGVRQFKERLGAQPRCYSSYLVANSFYQVGYWLQHLYKRIAHRNSYWLQHLYKRIAHRNS